MTDDHPPILIIDDQPLNLRVLATALADDFSVRMATNGPDALALARRSPAPEVILLDVVMPDMDGYAVCAALKADPLTAAIPVIFITVQTDAESETQALEGGAVDFISKPINPAVVKARVRVHRELAQHRHRLEALVEARTLELAQARDAAESANRAKTALLRNASHEMLTPLNHITGMGYLLRGDLQPGRGEERLTTIERAAQGLLGLVKRLLDLARLESSELHLERQAFSVRTRLEQTLEDYRGPAAVKGLGLALTVDPAVPDHLLGDPARLAQILALLLDNAVKFTEQGGIQVKVDAPEITPGRATLRVSVADTGVGIPPEIAAGLFAHFRQGDDSIARAHSGLGLGLALGQRLVRLMGGEIRLDSAPGAGTTATFWVPLTIAAPEQE